MNRDSVPSPVRRQLRQESGFGCCFCGHPFIQYHHIIPYAEEQHMRPEDMMAVCGNCHNLCTAGAISMIEQRTSKCNPRNIVEGITRGHLFTNKEKLIVHLAGGTAINTPSLLSVGGGTDIVRVEKETDGRLLVSALVQDEDGKVIAQLNRNQWSTSPEGPWDFETYPKRSIIRSAPQNISFEVDCRDDEIRLKGKWFLNGQKVLFTPSKCIVGGMSMIGFTVVNCGCFLKIG